MTITAPATDSKRHATAVIRPGLLDRLKTLHGLRTDAALAGAIGISESTLSKLRNGGEPSIGVVTSIVQGFGLGFGEVVIAVDALTAAERRELKKLAA